MSIDAWIEALEKRFPSYEWNVEKDFSPEFGEYIQVVCFDGDLVVYAEAYFKSDGYPSVEKVVENARRQLE